MKWPKRLIVTGVAMLTAAAADIDSLFKKQ